MLLWSNHLQVLFYFDNSIIKNYIHESVIIRIFLMWLGLCIFTFGNMSRDHFLIYVCSWVDKMFPNEKLCSKFTDKLFLRWTLDIKWDFSWLKICFNRKCCALLKGIINFFLTLAQIQSKSLPILSLSIDSAQT